jgi:MFS transporter, PPP family, 3-phenylpropionic acid transporter
MTKGASILLPKLSIRQRFALFYLIFYMATGVFFPYMAIYLAQHNIPGTQVGVLLGLNSLVGIFAQPLWSLISDVYQIRKGVLSIAALGLAVVSLGFGFSSSFIWLLTIIVLFSAMRAPILPLGNALVFDYLEAHDQQGGYGLLRVWGSVGFAIISFLAGAFLVETMIDLLPIFHAGFMILVALLAFFLPTPEPDESGNWIEGLRLLPQRPPLALFLLGTLFIGGPLITGVQYLSIYMGDLGAAGWLVGLSVSIMAILEIPFMRWSPRLMERFNISRLLLIGVLLLPLRWALFAVIREPLLILPVQVMHSIAIVTMMVVAATFVDRQLPPRWRATGQGLLTTSVLGLGPSLGQFVAGMVYDVYSLRVVWWGAMGVTFVGIGLMALALGQMTPPDSKGA